MLGGSIRFHFKMIGSKGMRSPIHIKKNSVPVSRNTLYIIIAVLVVGVAIIGFQLYQENQKTGVEINLGENGISIQEN